MYLHGVETIEIEIGPRSVKIVKSAVIALTGIAPIGDVNKMELVLGPKDAAKFGEELEGFNIPQSLNVIFQQGPATVLVVNTLDDTTNLTAVADEEQTVTNAKVSTTDAPIRDLVVKNEAADTTYTLGSDYKVDAFGNITIISFTNINEGDILKISYDKLNAASVTANQLIGDIDPLTDTYTGMELFRKAKNTFGFHPKIHICPGFTQLNGVVAKMAELVQKTRGHYVIDAPAETTFANAIAGRGPAGSINFYTSDPRAVLVYPRIKKYDPATGDNKPWWYSAFWAGLKSATDLDPSKGYWHSPSNRKIAGAEGLETEITSSLTDPTSQANLLNENGIVTIFQGFGTGIRSWGNRSAAWPASTKVENFVSIRSTADVIEESIEEATLQFMDKPINQALIDTIRNMVNAFLRSMVQKGAILDGECIYDQEENSATELAQGHVVFTYTFMPPPPMERVTYKAQLDVNLLTKLA